VGSNARNTPEKVDPNPAPAITVPASNAATCCCWIPNNETVTPSDNVLAPIRIRRRAGQFLKAATATAAVNISAATTTPPIHGETTRITVATTVGISER
jgi:hypothetical protein